ncbi:ABC transporter ATP-binding protein [Nocardiopsis halophila]|uniref:ABC transporter ATP-binding protein n=1 Tax=Nocardiopsis halophila TaxID=141692 RepID=UPI0003471044|nr:ABC transporter ATP-binding protein [Nocardiopsis halophila]
MVADRRRLGSAAALSLLATATVVLQPLALRQAVDAVGRSDPAGPAVAALVALSLLAASARAGQSYLLQASAERLVLGIRTVLTGRVLRLPMAELDRRSRGDLVSRVGADTSLVRATVTGGAFDIASAALVFTGAITVMAVLDPILLAATVGLLAGAAAVAARLGTRIRSAARESQERLSAVVAVVERALPALRTLRATGATGGEARSAQRAAQEAYAAGVRAARVRAGIQPVMALSVQGAFIVVLLVGGARVTDGAIGLGELVAFLFYLFLLAAPLSQAMAAYGEIQSGVAALDRIGEILRLAEEEEEGAHRRGGDRGEGPVPSARPAPAVELDRVRFAYPDGPEVLRDVSLRIERGRTTALVGPSGAGKSTILALIERFYDPDSGTVRVDGTDTATMERARLRSRLGYLEQAAPALSGTLAENLRLAAPEASDADLSRALADVGLSGLVEDSPDGLSTRVGDGGTLLSGGQRQRLAWARVLLADPEILLMDEPTSSVDARTEHALHELLLRTRAGRTVVVVAHRLSTAMTADRIAVVDGGRIRAVGTHGRLMERDALYQELAARQFIGPAVPGRGRDDRAAFPV